MELKLCKISTIGIQSENQTLPMGNISLGSPIVFSGWALHDISTHFIKPIKVFNRVLVIKLMPLSVFHI
ncbi:hypothetical protein DD742_00070 [Helicobacter pylori]|uniref:hypothetical protein n=1 Tax=Helicobacter pylori TaxID=210 RepID=UPI000EB1B57D|nr:hypothetical protein DD742_00070 [Helicobacter pylori]